MGFQAWSDEIWIVNPGDEPGFTEDLQSLRARMAKASPAPNVIVDLSAVDHLNSSQLSELLRVRKAVIDGQARVILTSLSDIVGAVFLATGLDKVFDFEGEVPLALARLQMED